MTHEGENKMHIKCEKVTLSLEGTEEVAIEIGKDQWLVVRKIGNDYAYYQKTGNVYERMKLEKRKETKS